MTQPPEIGPEAEHDSLIEWIGGSFDPERFERSDVVFDDPKERWRDAFEE